MLIQASRTRSAVGRTRASRGVASRRPPNWPATMRIARRASPGVTLSEAKGTGVGAWLLRFAQDDSGRTPAQPGDPSRWHVRRQRAQPGLQRRVAVPVVGLEPK